jgi:Trm5-related predicted tRNA methylase
MISNTPIWIKDCMLMARQFDKGQSLLKKELWHRLSEIVCYKYKRHLMLGVWRNAQNAFILVLLYSGDL